MWWGQSCPQGTLKVGYFLGGEGYVALEVSHPLPFKYEVVPKREDRLRISGRMALPHPSSLREGDGRRSVVLLPSPKPASEDDADAVSPAVSICCECHVANTRLQEGLGSSRCPVPPRLPLDKRRLDQVQLLSKTPQP